jgi:hypothetical protein
MSARWVNLQDIQDVMHVGGGGVTTTPDANIHGKEDGIEDVLCRSYYQPYKTRATHRHFRIIDKYGPERGYWVAFQKMYQPEDWRLDDRPEWTKPRLIEQLVSAWTTPVLIELTFDEGFRLWLDTAFKEAALPFDVFTRMLRWKRNLPGLCNREDPIETAIQAAFWILRLYDEVWENGLVPSAAVLELVRDMHPERKLLTRFLPSGLRRITCDDFTAARYVIHYCNLALFPGLTEWHRFRPDRPDGTRTPDWRIVRLMLSERLSSHDVAKRLGLDHSGVNKRFKEAIATISKAIGPLLIGPKSLFPQTASLIPRVERRIGKPTFKPQPSGDPPGYQTAKAELQLLAWAQGHFRQQAGIGPTQCPPGCAGGYREHGEGRFLSRPLLTNEHDAPWLKGTLHTEGQYRRMPPRAFNWKELAAALPAGEFKDQVLAAEAVIADLLVDKKWPPLPHWPDSKETERWGVGWFNNGLPYNRSPAVCETIVGWWSVPWVQDPSLRPAQRICGMYNDGSVFWWPSGGAHLVPAPRKYSANVSSPHFCGPVIEVNGRIRPRAYINVDAVFNDTAARFERALTRAEDALF